MRVVHLVAGTGSMYCGSCLQGNTLVAALRRRGHDALLAPLYLPLRTDEENLSLPQISLGGVNVFLSQFVPLWGKLPARVRRWLDAPALLRWASRRGGGTKAENLGALCVSMLRGDEGRQSHEIDRLIEFLAPLEPEVVHLNNLLLVGVARPIQRKLGVPVVATLSGEDVFLERLGEPYRQQAAETLQQRAAELAGLVALNRYFAGHMAEYLRLPAERVEVIPPGLDLLGHAQPQPAQPPRVAGPLRIGYLSRVCHDKGLHLLVEAVAEMLAQGPVRDVTLVAAGTLHRDDREYLAAVERCAAESGLGDRFEYHGELDRAAKIAFLQSLDVFCLPAVYRESKGLPAFEAWANGVPIVAPAHGVFPEIFAETGGGELFEPHSAKSLAETLVRVALDLDAAREKGRRAQAIVHERFHADAMAARTETWYRRLVGSAEPAAPADR